jgi:cyclic pyranopterin phosphate synthase
MATQRDEGDPVGDGRTGATGSTSWTHLDEQGRARMVDVGSKDVTSRLARARAVFHSTPDVRDRLLRGDLPKGEALAVARIAGIQAAKETGRLIPLCHPLPLDGVTIGFEAFGEDGVEIVAEVRCTGRTGIEMEAMAAVTVAALTLYDMTKALCRGARIGGVCLLHKAGGRSGVWDRAEGPPAS